MAERTPNLWRRSDQLLERLLAGEWRPLDTFRPRSRIGSGVQTLAACVPFVIGVFLIRSQSFVLSAVIAVLGAAAVLLLGRLLRTVETWIGATAATRRRPGVPSGPDR